MHRTRPAAVKNGALWAVRKERGCSHRPFPRPVWYSRVTSRRFATLPKFATEIKVYSNQPEVELTLNGTSLGKKQAPDHVFLWTGITWATGANLAQAAATSAAGATDQATWTN
jgi:hypothetical protein